MMRLNTTALKEQIRKPLLDLHSSRSHEWASRIQFKRPLDRLVGVGLVTLLCERAG
jgi:hypothetical protein